MPDEAAQDDDWKWVDEDSADWVPPPLDTTRASVARIYDYLLGGKDNFAVDRAAGDRLRGVFPDAEDGARANRAFLTRVVREMAEAGIDQFLDLGSGIPTAPNVHEVARAVRPDAAVVYVDNDPVVLAQARALATGDPRLAVVSADLREPMAVLADARVRKVLDPERPIGLLLVAVLHFVDPVVGPQIVARYVRDLAIGSRVAITAACRDGMSPQAVRDAEQIYAQASAPVTARTTAQVEELFEGLTLLPPLVRPVFRFPDGGSVLGGVAVR
jgi:hypothetical protein